MKASSLSYSTAGSTLLSIVFYSYFDDLQGSFGLGLLCLTVMLAPMIELKSYYSFWLSFSF